MPKKAKVYMPTGKVDDYLPYFERIEDENFDDTFYLVRSVKIEEDCPLFAIALKEIENDYNTGTSGQRNWLESQGMKFEYTLNVDQTNSYKLVINDAAKAYASKAYLHIGYMEGEFSDLNIILAGGLPYGSYDVIDALTGEGKEFLQMLIKKKLLKKKTIQLETFDINEIRIDDNN